MAANEHIIESELPYSKQKVFIAIKGAILKTSALKIKEDDELQGRIIAMTNIGLSSWGNDVTIQLFEQNSEQTRIHINLTIRPNEKQGATFDLNRNRKNIEKVLSTASHLLKEADLKKNPKNSNSFDNQNRIIQSQKKETNSWYESNWLVLLLCVVFFPIGIYGLWKNSTFGKPIKIIITLILGLLVISYFVDNEKATNDTKNSIEKSEDLIIDIKSIAGKTLEDVEKKLGKAEATEDVSGYPCETAKCTKSFFKNRKYEILFKNKLSNRITIYRTQNLTKNDNAIQVLGLPLSKYSFKNPDFVIRWENVQGIAEINFNSDFIYIIVAKD